MEQRLSKVLAAAGVASRRACEKIIFDGRVTVNGTVITVPQTPVSWEKDLILVDGEQLKGEQKKVYYMLHKTCGTICSNKHGSGRREVLRPFKDNPERLFTVGRLDKDTSGLLLVTNDGHFAQKVIHPSSGIQKEYLAKTAQEISHEHLCMISKGAYVEGIFIKPVSVKKIRKGTVKVTVMEGKKHEVRHLLANAKLKVLELKRIRIGNLVLGSLPLGQWRPLSTQEREQFLR